MLLRVAVLALWAFSPIALAYADPLPHPPVLPPVVAAQATAVPHADPAPPAPTSTAPVSTTKNPDAPSAQPEQLSQALVGLPKTGSDLVLQITSCRKLPLAQQASRFCTGYSFGVVMGVLFEGTMQSAATPFCLSPNMTSTSIDQAVLDLVHTNQMFLQQPSSFVLITALQMRFPCAPAANINSDPNAPSKNFAPMPPAETPTAPAAPTVRPNATSPQPSGH